MATGVVIEAVVVVVAVVVVDMETGMKEANGVMVVNMVVVMVVVVMAVVSTVMEEKAVEEKVGHNMLRDLKSRIYKARFDYNLNLYMSINDENSGLKILPMTIKLRLIIDHERNMECLLSHKQCPLYAH
jgi:hypothetical protein